MPESTDVAGWRDSSIPNKGWSCVNVLDLEEPSQHCQMCKAAVIRYAHVMRHPDYARDLEVGCVCAEKMSGDYVRPKLHEDVLRTVARRKINWRLTWKQSRKGNLYHREAGYVITMFETESGHKFVISRQDHRRFCKQTYSDLTAAKDAALLLLTGLKKGLTSL